MKRVTFGYKPKSSPFRYRIFLAIPVLLLVSGILSQTLPRQTGAWKKDWAEANRLYELSEPTEATDSMARDLYQKVIRQLHLYPTLDSVAALAWIRWANIHQSYQQYGEANTGYHQALPLTGAFPQLQYEAWLYLGSSHYFANAIDSARYFFEKASQLITEKAKEAASFPEKERLYNSLGAIYFESANYTQAANYFQQAKKYVVPGSPEFAEMVTSIESNIANCFMKQDRYDTAIQILQSLSPTPAQQEIIRQNIAHSYFALGKHDSALSIYNTLKPVSGFNRVIALNNIGRIFIERRDWQRAEKVFDSSIAESRKAGAHIRNKEEAQAYLYRGKLAANQGLYTEALSWMNEALREIHLDFTPSGWRDNPVDITRSVSPITLFQVLKEKANLLYQIHQKNQDVDYLRASIQTYRSTIQTGLFIRVNFDNDEAKLLFTTTHKTLYSQAMAVAHTAFEKGLDVEEDILYFLENYKGTILAQHLRNIELKNQASVPQAVKTREKELKQLLAVYVSRMNRAAATSDIRQVQDKWLETQVELSRLQKLYETDSSFLLYRYQQVQKQYSLREIQDRLGASHALLHYFSDDSLYYLLTISGREINFSRIEDGRALEQDVKNFIGQLRDQTEGRRFEARSMAHSLYRRLIGPHESILGKTPSMTIIPDGLLFYLPFEALMPSDEPKDYLVLTKTIGYHYSVDLLLENKKAVSPPEPTSGGLGLAPFEKGDQKGWSHLPASPEELPATYSNYLGEQATREVFLKNASRYAWIHLATHASLADSSQSFIQFYPAQDSLEKDRLYLPEIYNLDLHHTRLIILSACETGGGQQVLGEGLLSLSRAFLYAGTEGIVATLWKTEDKVSAYLMQRFHHYLEKGIEPAAALHQSKTDLIHAENMPDRYKTPNYWSNFIYLGKIEEPPRKSNFQGFLWPALFIILQLVLLGFGAKRSAKPA